jgi:hypothetical protein
MCCILCCSHQWSVDGRRSSDACSLTVHSRAQALQAILLLMRRPIPDTSMLPDDSEREKQAGWKLRKWVLRIAYRVLQRYGDPKLTRTDASQPFAKLFLSEFTQPFLHVCAPPDLYLSQPQERGGAITVSDCWNIYLTSHSLQVIFVSRDFSKQAWIICYA